MGWVVTSWRIGAPSPAAREIADARAHLDALERFGADARAEIRRRRLALRTDGAGATAPVASCRPGRASLRESPLTELFRATAER